MQSKDADAVDAVDWENWRPTRPPGPARRNRWPWVFLALVVLGHGWVAWLAWTEDTLRTPRVQVEEALLINFIDRPAARQAPRRLPDRPQSSASNRQGVEQLSRLDSGSDSPVQQDPATSTAPLRLGLEIDPWNLDPLPAARNLTANQPKLVLEHGRPRLRGVQLRERTSPKQALAMLGAFFGSPPYDPCPQVSARLANLHSELHHLDLAADLLTRERYCQR